jgi:hypothetical integral membrane protein (TIGR02206 family)
MESKNRADTGVFIMKKFFEYHSKLDLFRPFSIEHILTIAIIVTISLLLFIYRNKLEGRRKFVRYTLAFIILIANVCYHLWLVSEHAWSMKRALPLQLSDLSALLAVVMLWSRSDRIFQFMYFAGLGSAIQAIVTPDLYHFSFPHFLYFQSFVSHGGVVLACLFMVVAFSCRPSIRSLWVSVLIVNLYALVVFFINKRLDSNYMYMMKKAGMNTILNLLGPWPWYYLSVEMVMIVSFYLLYSPFWIKSKFEKRKTAF